MERDNVELRPLDARAGRVHITLRYHVEYANCHSISHGAAYRGCPGVMAFDKQTKQRNSLLKENYEKQLRKKYE